MLSKRVIAISSEKGFQKKLAAALMAAGGAVEILGSTDELSKEPDADLLVYHVTEFPDPKLAALMDRLKKDVRLVTIVPTSDLDKMIQLLKDERLANCLVAENMDTTMLSGVATRLLYGDVFGLEKFMPWGVRIYSMLVGDYQEKSVAIAAVSDFAAAMGVRRKYRESIEQCLDELLMNALYDAPVDTDGKQMFADVPTKTRISLRMEQKAVIQYACDGNQFAVSVRDSFGALKKDTVVKYIDKCLHAGAEKQIDRKTGGAGLGLYIIANSTTQFVLNLYPGVATEAVCTFQLDVPKVQLRNFGVFNERIDASGRLVGTGSSRLAGAGRGSAPLGKKDVVVSSAGLRAALAAAVALVLVLAGIVLYPLVAKEKPGRVEVTTEPAGATIEIDGRSHGQANPTLKVDGLDPGSHRVTARLPGHRLAEQVVEVRSGQMTPIPLRLDASTAVVRVRSTPPGAMVSIDGQERGVTPIDLSDLAPGAEHKLVVSMFGYVDDEQPLRVPTAGGEAQLSTALRVSPDYGTLKINSEPRGAIVTVNDSVELPQPTPINEYMVKSATVYQLTIRAKGHLPQKLQVAVSAGEKRVINARLAPAGMLTIEDSVPEARVFVDGEPVAKLPMVEQPVAAGKHRIEVRGKRPWISVSKDVEVKQGQVLPIDFQLGYVEITIPNATALPDGARGAGATRLALPAGKHTLVVTVKGDKSDVDVVVKAGETKKIDEVD